MMLNVKNTCSADDPIVAERLETFRQEVWELFLPSSRYGHWLIFSTKRKLGAYSLKNVDPWDVITEAYIRANTAILNGKLIWNSLSWMKSASNYIIQEELKKRDDVTLFADMSLFDDSMKYDPLDVVTQKWTQEDLSSILECILQPRDRELLLWRYQQGLSWKQIQEKFISSGSLSVPTVVALRQQCSRAVKRVRRYGCHALK